MSYLRGFVRQSAVSPSLRAGLPALSVAAASALSKIHEVGRGGVPEVVPGVKLFTRPGTAVSDNRYHVKRDDGQPGGPSLVEQATSSIAQSFRDATVAYKSRTVSELLRAIAVFETCKVPWIVRNADNLLNAAGGVSRRLTDAVVKKTFFAQFCAGENEDEVKPLIQRLRSSNVGAILDYAAEADIGSVKDQSSSGSLYSPATETHCDSNLEKYLKAVSLSASGNNKTPPDQQVEPSMALQGVVAVKVTSLANPLLLKRLSSAADEADLTAEEEILASKALARCLQVGAAARSLGVRLLVDAEQSYFQPAIDRFALRMMRDCNIGALEPVVFNTYQCYLKDSHEKLNEHLELAEAEGWQLGAKLVRGAYMKSERERAQELGYPSPIHDTIEDTHKSFDSSMELMLRQVYNGTGKVVIASHNEQSVIKAMKIMEGLGMPNMHAGVMFGQLQGMCDFLTYSLSAKGYQAYKYLPYGPLHEVMPYLIRRAQENSGVLGNTNIEKDLMLSEVRRRISSSSPRPSHGFAASGSS